MAFGQCQRLARTQMLSYPHPSPPQLSCCDHQQMFASSCCSYGTDSDRTGQRGHCWPDYMLACLLTGPPEQQQQQQRSSSSSSCTNRAHQFVCRAIRSYFTITKGHHATQICRRTVHIQQRCSPSVLQSNVLSARKFISPLLLGPIRESFFTPCFICNVVVQTFGCHEICPMFGCSGRPRMFSNKLFQNSSSSVQQYGKQSQTEEKLSALRGWMGFTAGTG